MFKSKRNIKGTVLKICSLHFQFNTDISEIEWVYIIKVEHTYRDIFTEFINMQVFFCVCNNRTM